MSQQIRIQPLGNLHVTTLVGMDEALTIQPAPAETATHVHEHYLHLVDGHSDHLHAGEIPPPFYAPDPFTGKGGVAAGKEASATGDPHIREADGGNFDFQGVPGRTYNMIHDSGFTLNAWFQAYGDGGATTIGRIGAIVSGPCRSSVIEVDPRSVPSTRVNGQPVCPGQTIRLADGGSLAVSADGRSVTFSTAEGYQNTITIQGDYLDYAVRSGTGGVAADGRRPGGVIGHTFDGNDLQRNGRTGAGAQGEGAIDGVYTDYEVEGLFGSPQTEYTAEEIQRLWIEVSEKSTARLLHQTGQETHLSEKERSRRHEKIIEMALNSGNIDLAILLLTSLQARESNDILKGLMGKMQKLQEERRQIAGKIEASENSAEGAKQANVLNLEAGNIGTEIGILQTFIQDVMSQKAESQAMASNILKSRHDTAMGILRNIA